MGAREGEPERRIRVQRGERVYGVMPLRERKLEPQGLAIDGEASRSGSGFDVVRVEAPNRDVVASEIRRELRRAGGNHSRTVGRERSDGFGICLCNPLDRPEKLEVLRADMGYHGDVRARDLAQSCDLPEATHAHLRDEDGGLGEMDDRKRMGMKVLVVTSVLFAMSVWVKRYKWAWLKSRKIVYDPPKTNNTAPRR